MLFCRIPTSKWKVYVESESFLHRLFYLEGNIESRWVRFSRLLDRRYVKREWCLLERVYVASYRGSGECYKFNNYT